MAATKSPLPINESNSVDAAAARSLVLDKYRPCRRRTDEATVDVDTKMTIVYLYSDLDNTKDDLLEMELVHRKPLVMIRTMIKMTSFGRRTGVEKPKLTEIMGVTIVDVEAVAEIELDGVAPGAELVVEGVGELVDEARFDMDSEGYAD
jgi:hypothetical protein